MKAAKAHTSSAPAQSGEQLHNGNPPWHAVALIVAFVAIFVQQLPVKQSQVPETTFSHVLFPTIFPLRLVICMRLLFASIIFTDCFRAFALVEYLDHQTEYHPGSALKAGAPIHYRGILTKDGTLQSAALGVASFTMVTWLLEGLVFLSAALLPLYSNESTTAINGIVLCAWEIVAPTALLITLVVTYVLWPFAVAAERSGKKGNVGLLNRLGPLLAHNMNILAITTELSLLGGLPIRLDHFAMAPLYGSAYVIFSWAMKDQWLPQLSQAERKAWGPQFLYPFMDTSLGWQHTASLAALLLVLLMSHIAIYALQYFLRFGIPFLFHALPTIDDENALFYFAAHCATVLGVGGLVCRFR